MSIPNGVLPENDASPKAQVEKDRVTVINEIFSLRSDSNEVIFRALLVPTEVTKENGEFSGVNHPRQNHA